MSIAVICPPRKPEGWIRELSAQAPDIELQVWPEITRPESVLMVLTWQHPAGELTRYPNLKCIASMGAGVDHILSDQRLPDSVPIVRIVDDNLNQDMFEYVLASVLMIQRHLHVYGQCQRVHHWRPRRGDRIRDTRVGLMGLGKLGGFIAAQLAGFGFQVRGWATGAKRIDGVACFAGTAQLPDFMAGLDVLVCLLPLTDSTQKILNRDTLAMLPEGAALINVARGALVEEEALLAALDSGQLSVAVLDVFEQEPLPQEHPFWQNNKILVTPHIASYTDPATAAAQVIENYRRIGQGELLVNQIDRQKGY